MKKLLTTKNFFLGALLLAGLVIVHFLPIAAGAFLALAPGATIVADRQKHLGELRTQLDEAETEMSAIYEKSRTEKRSRTDDEKKKWGELKTKAEGLVEEIRDLEDQIKRDREAATRAGNLNLPVDHSTPGKSDVGKEEVKNIRRARVANFFRAANPAFRYKLEGVELELSKEAEKEIRSFKETPTGELPNYDPSKGATIPAIALRHMAWNKDQLKEQQREQRDIQATASGLGIELINTDTLESNYVEALRPQNVLMNAGVEVIQNDSGANVVFPRESSLYTAAMASTENATASESLTSSAFVNPALTFSPKRGTGYVQVSNQLLLQAPWWEMRLRNQITKGNAILMDTQGINGSGSSGQAKGILNTSGTQTVVGGTNGANFQRTHITQFESGVGAAGADLNMCRYITNFAVNAYGKRTEFSTGSGRYLVDWAPQWLWSNMATGKGGQTVIDQYPAFLSANVPSNLTKGTSTTVCSAVIFGDVSKMVYMNFGGIQIIVDPYVNATSALTNYIVHFWFDFNVILPGAVSYSLDMLTP